MMHPSRSSRIAMLWPCFSLVLLQALPFSYAQAGPLEPVLAQTAVATDQSPASVSDVVIRLPAPDDKALAAVPSLDLIQAYRLAFDRDAQIKVSRATAQAAYERLPQAKAQLYPNISLSMGRSYNSLDSTTPNPLTGAQISNSQSYNSANDSLTLRQPLYRKPLMANLRQAEFVVEDAKAQLEKDTQGLVMRVAQAYFETLFAEEQIDVIRRQQAAYVAQLDAASKALIAGVGTRTDIDAARAKLDMATAQELQVRQALDLARRKLEVLVGQPVRQLADVDVRSLKFGPPEPETVEGWMQRAEAASPELTALRAQVEAARQGVEAAAGGHYPTLDGIAQVAHTVSDNPTRVNYTYDQRYIGLQLQIPIYQGGLVSSQVREALARQQRAEAALEATRLDLLVRLQNEFRGVGEGVLRIRALEQAVRSAERFVTSSQRSFEAGVRTRIDILNAQQQLAEALRDLAQARFVYLNSLVRLNALAGEPIEQNLAAVNRWLATVK